MPEQRLKDFYMVNSLPQIFSLEISLVSEACQDIPQTLVFWFEIPISSKDISLKSHCGPLKCILMFYSSRIKWLNMLYKVFRKLF